MKKPHQPVPGLLLLLNVKIKSFFNKQANKNKTYRFWRCCTDLFGWLVLMQWKVTCSCLQFHRPKNTWHTHCKFRRPRLLQDYIWRRRQSAFTTSAHSCEQNQSYKTTFQYTLKYWLFFFSTYYWFSNTVLNFSTI